MTLASVCTPCIGEEATTATTIAMPSMPASDQPRRLRFGFVMTGSLHRRNRILQRHTLSRLHAFADDELFLAAPRDLHQPLVPAAARPLNVGHRTTLFLEDCARGNQHRIRYA